MKKNDYVLGIILILAGIFIFLENTNIVPNETYIVVLGIAFLIGYYNKKKTGYLIAGLILTGIGLSQVLDRMVYNLDLSGLLVFIGLGAAFLIVYFTKGKEGFVYPGCILPAIGIHSFLEDLIIGDIGWLFFFLISISFYAIYLLIHRNKGVKWTFILGSILLALSGLFYMTENNIITSSFWKMISYFWPVILILIGIRIIYNNSKKE
ncbi:MAG: hypothetical protein FH751_08535 [Firmicutes bacterium]|nr:hypothetical protein [Bacillota bacterium]